VSPSNISLEIMSKPRRATKHHLQAVCCWRSREARESERWATHCKGRAGEEADDVAALSLSDSAGAPSHGE
jgi:hypothetical protein